MADDRAIRVMSGTVSLKLTLTPKLLKKSFADAVLSPYIKAYNKKMCARIRAQRAAQPKN